MRLVERVGRTTSQGFGEGIPVRIKGCKGKADMVGSSEGVWGNPVMFSGSGGLYFY